jgi:hypothetical protein
VASTGATGTEIEIRLPRANPPIWFTSEITLPQGAEVIVLDDDKYNHVRVREKLSPYLDQIELKSFSSVEDFRHFLATPATRPRVYLLDQYISNETLGIDLIRQFGIGKESILVTSANDDVALQAQVVKLGSKILPKGLLAQCKIKVGSPRNYSL